MLFIAYLLALIVGIILALLGSGGSILTVPILVYILDLNPVSATAHSLFIVGMSSLFGAQRLFNSYNINYKITLYFAIPSLIGVFVSRKWILPNIPEFIHFFHFYTIQKDDFILVFLAFLMFLASFSILFSFKPIFNKKHTKNNFVLILIDGYIVGVITGLVGAGGGFLIIPALLYLTNFSIKEAVKASLLIISIKSIFGFTAELNNSINWSLLLFFTTFSIFGILIGSYFVKFINESILKKSFGIFILMMSLFILLKEIFI
tara:strand:- start:24 stop:809 length:786 start_codon:yes stop_codon:yes gene_type:complete